MIVSPIELREKRAGLIKQAREVMERGRARDGGATAEDTQEFDRLMKEASVIKEDYERWERLEAEERSLDAPEPRRSDPLRDREPPGRHGAARTAKEYRGSAEYRSLYSEWLRSGYMRYEGIPPEFRDTILGTDAKGGYMATPVQLADEIVKIINDQVFIRRLAKVITMGEAKSLGVVQLSAHMADDDWTTEVQAVTEDVTMAFGRRDLSPNLVSKLSKVSIRMLYGSTNTEELIRDELGYKNAVTEEKAYLTGNGTGQPLGIFTASASGVPTARDVSAGNTATAIGADNLFQTKYSLKAGYRQDPTTRWLLSRTAVMNIMLLKDSQNRYLWQPSIQQGTPDMLLNLPVAESEYVPNTFTTGLYVGALGALRYYYIAQVDDLQIQRLVERYADTNQVGFISRRWVDGSPVLGEAFSRIKLA
jgi:HK97 family phage major capsid protein